MMSILEKKLRMGVLGIGVLVCMALLAAGCSDGNTPASPMVDSGSELDKAGGPPTGTGTIRISANIPSYSWTLTLAGPGGFTLGGFGPSTLEDYPVGTYTIVWHETAGYVAKPASQRGRLKNNQTLEFDTVYYIILSSDE